MLGDLSGVSKIFVITGRTDMRKSFDGLMAIVRDSYDLDPYSNALFLFCGRDCRKIKALHFDKDGFVLMQKKIRWQRSFPVATQCLGSTPAYKTGIPMAHGGAGNRSAQGNQSWKPEKRLLMFVQNREK